MKRRKPSEGELAKLIAIARFQFGEDVAGILFEDLESIEVDVTGRGKIRHVYLEGERLLTLRPNDGYYSLGMKAAELIVKRIPSPRLRIIVKGDRELKGSVLVVDVVGFDESLRPGDECIIVDKEDNLIGIGRVKIPPLMLEGLDRGEVVRLRHKKRGE